MCLLTEYGAPEDGELKLHQPFLLKNQLLSKNPTLKSSLLVFVSLGAETEWGARRDGRSLFRKHREHSQFERKEEFADI